MISLYYVISATGVVCGKNLNEVNRKCNAQFDDDEFVGCGSDFVTKIDVDDLSFVQDKKRLSMIPIRNLYKKDNTIKLLIIANLVLTFFTLVRGG